MDIGIIGGTGSAGRGLGLRLAAAGMSVAIGSRDPTRAAGVVEEMVERWTGRLGGSLRGLGNAEAAGGKVVVLATPWDAAVRTVAELAERLDGKVLVSMANALVRDGQEMVPLF
ncbi:MAG: NADPH-dependent F420 reductase, partial [Acidimicrobiales bacterium]